MVTGSDDMLVRVFNYNTLEKSHSFEAHTDYIRSIVVHPTHPYILTSSGNILSLSLAPILPTLTYSPAAVIFSLSLYLLQCTV